MPIFSGAPVSDAYYQRVDANDQKSAQNLMKLSQLLQMQKAAQEMQQYPQESRLREAERQARIEELQAHAQERGLKTAASGREQALFQVLRTSQPGSPEYKQAWTEMQIMKAPERAFAAPAAPKMRERISGEKTIQEEFQPDGTWKELSSGPRFARQVPSVINVGGGASKPPSGYRLTTEGNLEPIPGGPADVKAEIVRQKEIDKATGVDNQLDAIERNINKLMKDGKATPGLKSYVGQLDQYYPEWAMSSETSAAGSALKSLQDQMTMVNLASAKAAVGQSFGSMQVKEWEKFTNGLTNIMRGVPDKEMESNLEFVNNFIKNKRDVLRTAIYAGTHGPKGAAATSSPTTIGAKVMTMQDVMDTAKQTGKTIDQVLSAAKAKGYAVK